MNCQLCGGEIPAERLEAIPETRICVGCSQRVGGEFRLIVNQERTSKPGSMKLNYGGINVQLVRRSRLTK
jgi:hypothetical protein